MSVVGLLLGVAGAAVYIELLMTEPMETIWKYFSVVGAILTLSMIGYSGVSAMLAAALGRLRLSSRGGAVALSIFWLLLALFVLFFSLTMEFGVLREFLGLNGLVFCGLSCYVLYVLCSRTGKILFQLRDDESAWDGVETAAWSPWRRLLLVPIAWASVSLLLAFGLYGLERKLGIAEEDEVGEKVSIQLRPKPGARYRVVDSWETYFDRDAEEKTFLRESVVVESTVWVQKVADDGAITIQEKVESVRVEHESEGGTSKYDSNDPSAGDDTPTFGAQLFIDLLDLPIQRIVSPRAKVLKVHGLDALLARIGDRVDADSESEESKEEVLAKVKPIYERMFWVFIDRYGVREKVLVSVGSKWRVTHRETNPSRFDTKATTRFEVVSVDEERVRIQLRSRVRSSGEDKEIRLRGESNGEALVDRATGWPQEIGYTEQQRGKHGTQAARWRLLRRVVWAAE